VLHSEGFGLEINRPLIAQLGKKLKTKNVIQKYEASSWKLGFLAELDESTRGLVLAHLNEDKNSPYYKKIPWHKNVYRWYRGILGDPKYKTK
jgi:hypothetical protein